MDLGKSMRLKKAQTGRRRLCHYLSLVISHIRSEVHSRLTDLQSTLPIGRGTLASINVKCFIQNERAVVNPPYYIRERILPRQDFPWDERIGQRKSVACPADENRDAYELRGLHFEPTQAKLQRSPYKVASAERCGYLRETMSMLCSSTMSIISIFIEAEETK